MSGQKFVKDFIVAIGVIRQLTPERLPQMARPVGW